MSGTKGSRLTGVVILNGMGFIEKPFRPSVIEIMKQSDVLHLDYFFE